MSNDNNEVVRTFFRTDALYRKTPSIVYARDREDAQKIVESQFGPTYTVGAELPVSNGEMYPEYPPFIGFIAETYELSLESIRVWNSVL